MVIAAAGTGMHARLAFDSGCVLGESIVWCDRQRALWWTDIEACRIWRQAMDAERAQAWNTPGRVGSLALCESGKLLLGMEDGVFIADPMQHAPRSEIAVTRLCHVPLEGRAMRINDGRVDRDGNFVFGTVNEDSERARIGRFHQYSRQHGVRTLDLDGVAIPNSICFTPDDMGMYYCDSLQRRIMHVSYDAANARVDAPRIFAIVEPPIEPDGAIVDAEGGVWSAQWGGARVVRYLPDGTIDRVLAVPTPQPTCVAFAGDALDALFITSARKGLDDATLRAHPDAGGVFTASVSGIRGMRERRFADA